MSNDDIGKRKICQPINMTIVTTKKYQIQIHQMTSMEATNIKCIWNWKYDKWEIYQMAKEKYDKWLIWQLWNMKNAYDKYCKRRMTIITNKKNDKWFIWH